MKFDNIDCDPSITKENLEKMAEQLRNEYTPWSGQKQNTSIVDSDVQKVEAAICRRQKQFKVFISILLGAAATIIYINLCKQAPRYIYFSQDLTTSIFIVSTLLLYAIISNIHIIYKFFTGEEYRNNNDAHKDDEHDEITFKVYRRLLLRNTVLSEAEKMATLYCAHDALTKKYEAEHPKTFWKKSANRLLFAFSWFRIKKINSNITKENTEPAASSETSLIKSEIYPYERSYNLAVTDLFVEKALTYLNRKAKIYSRQGFMLVTLALLSIAVAGCIALNNMNPIDAIRPILRHEELATHIMIIAFTKSFTFYGLIILFAVYAGRMGKALFDQAERMKDRRHALRQGRLFVHLNGGKLTIDELDKAFNWNTSQDNAFYHFNPEAQAPWGTMFKEMMLTLRETAKSSMELAKSVKKDS